MFPRILNIGITKELDLYQKRETQILNLFALITLTGLAAGSVNIFFLKKAFPFFPLVFEALASVVMLIFNYKKLYKASAYSYVISMSLCLFYINSYYDSSSGSFLFYFPVIFCIALLYNPNKPKSRHFIFLSIIVLSLFGSYFLPESLIGNANLTAEENHIMFTFNIYFCALLTVALVYLVINLIYKQNKELMDVIKTVEEDKITIKNSLNEKEVLLAEVQHRVKNNLAIIIGLFNLQKDNSANEELKNHINEAKNRVLSIAMVHERLYKKEDLSKINLKYYISELTKEVIRSYPLGDKVEIIEEMENIDSNITKAVPIGLIINEAVTNSLKHAFGADIAKPTIKIHLTTHFDQICIKIQDNGKGFSNLQQRNEKSLGLSLIESLAEQIDGNIHYNNHEGACVKLSFPILR